MTAAMRTYAPHSFDVMVLYAPGAVDAVRSFADRLRRIGCAPWLLVEQRGFDADPVEGVQLGLQASKHVGMWLDDELMRQPWFPLVLPLLAGARQRGQRMLAWGHARWDQRRLGPPPDGASSIPADLTEAGRLWVAACGLWEQDPGPAPSWSSRGQELWAQPLMDKAAQARALVEGGDLHAAADLYSDILDADPDSSHAHIARGRIWLDLGDFSRAMSDFMVAQDLGDDPEADVATGDLFFARKDYARAIESYDRALEQLPDHAMALTRRGMCHHYRKNDRQALKDLAQAEQIDPNIPNLATYVAMVRRMAR